MPDIPRPAIAAAAKVHHRMHCAPCILQACDGVPDELDTAAVCAILEAALPELARHTAAKITACAQRRTVARRAPDAIDRHLAIAARIAAAAFTTEAELLAEAREALAGGDFAACRPEGELREAISAEYDRLAVPREQRHTYTYALALGVLDGEHVPDSELPHILARLESCGSLGDLQSLAERGVITSD